MLKNMDALLTREQAAAVLGLKSQTLAAWACRGTGPPYIRCGGAIRYSVAALERWLQARTVGAASGGEACRD